MIDLINLKVFEYDKFLFSIDKINPYRKELNHIKKIKRWQGRNFEIFYAHNGIPYCIIEID